MNADTKRDLADIVRSVLRRTVSCFGDDDTLMVERARRSVLITYSPVRASAPPDDLTSMKLRLRRDTHEMWIGSLHVAVPFRSRGLGRELVEAAEEIARATGALIVNALPLYASRPFWLKMGYRRLVCTSRVLSKHVRLEGSAPELPTAHWPASSL